MREIFTYGSVGGALGNQCFYPEMGKRQRAENRKRREFWTVAFKENMILERYFGETLRGSGYRWSEERKREIEEWADLGGDYESPVSKQLFIRFTERYGRRLELIGLV